VPSGFVLARRADDASLQTGFGGGATKPGRSLEVLAVAEVFFTASDARIEIPLAA